MSILPILLLLPSLAAEGDDASSGSGDPARDVGGRGDEGGAEEEEVEVLVVTGSMSETPLSESIDATDVVTHEEIREAGAGDASKALESEAGIEVQRTFRGAAVRIQGLAPEHALVLLDSFRVAGRRDGVIDLSRFPTELIDHVEIVRGAASAQYGSEAMGGVINIITREPDRPFASTTWLEGGSLGRIEASETLQLKREGGWLVLAPAYRRNDSYDWNPDDPDTDVAAAEQGSVFAKGRLDLGPSATLMLGGDYLVRDSRGVYSERAGDAENATVQGAVYDWRNLTEDASLRSGLELLPDDRTKVTVQAQYAYFRSQFAEDQRGSDEQNSYDDDREQDGQLRAMVRRRLAPGNWLTAGGEALFEAVRSERLDVDGWGTRWRAAVFAIDEMRLGPAEQLSILPAGRVDYDSHFGLHATPRLSVRYDPAETLALRASAGTGYRAPSFREMYLRFENPAANYIFVGNPDLEPETSYHLSAGPEWAPVPALQLRVEGFYNRVTHMFSYSQVSDATKASDALWTYENIASALTEGADAVARIRAGRWLGARLSYTFLYAIDLDTGDPLEQRSRHSIGATVTARHPSWGTALTVRGRWASPKPFWQVDEDENGETIVYQEWIAEDPWLAARVEQRALGGALRVFAQVDNILDAGDDRYYHYVPRTWSGGLAVDLPPRPRGGDTP